MQKDAQNLNQEGERKMIKTERGTTEIKGEINENLTDYELIARAMRNALSEKMGE